MTDKSLSSLSATQEQENAVFWSLWWDSLCSHSKFSNRDCAIMWWFSFFFVPQFETWKRYAYFYVIYCSLCYSKTGQCSRSQQDSSFVTTELIMLAVRLLSAPSTQILETNSQRDDICLIEANTLTQTLSLTHGRALAGDSAGQKLKLNKNPSNPAKQKMKVRAFTYADSQNGRERKATIPNCLNLKYHKDPFFF